MLDLYSYGWLLLPIGVYFIIKKQCLDLNQLIILLISNLMLFMLIFDGWFTQLSLMFLTGVQSCLILFAAKQSQQIHNDDRYHDKNYFISFLLKIPLQQLIIPIALLGFWLIFRIHTLIIIDQSNIHNMNLIIQQKYSQLSFSQLLVQLKGWNCTFPQFTVYPSVWLFILIIATIIANYLINIQKKCDHKYQLFLLKYKISVDIFCLFVNLLYNLFAYLGSKNPWDCLSYRNQYSFLKQIIHIIIYCGIPIGTFYFFLMKRGQFIIQQKHHLQNFEQKRQMDIQLLENPFQK